MAETMKDYEAELEASFKKIEEGDVVDKIKQPKVDEEGNPVLQIMNFNK